MFPGLVLMLNRSNKRRNQGGEKRKHDDRPDGENELREPGEWIGAPNLLTAYRIHAEDKNHNDQRAENRQAQSESAFELQDFGGQYAVSYTHLDVYKRQFPRLQKRRR